MSKHAVSAIASLRPILPASFRVCSSAPQVEIQRISGVPFFRDPAHTTPTRKLYRQLLRSTDHVRRSATPSSTHDGDHVDWQALRTKVRTDWRKRRGWTSIPQTQAFLDAQRDFLDALIFEFTPSQALIDLSHKLADQQRRAAQRASSTGRPPQPYVAGFLRPSVSNPAIPRLKPQPLGLTMMILSRVRARERRVALQKDLAAQAQELKDEINFWRRVKDKDGLEDAKGFLLQVRERQAELQVLFGRHEKRKATVFSEGVVRRVMKAKRDRQAFKRQRAERKRTAVAETDKDNCRVS